VPRILRNPLYHWTHMELKRPFGIRDRLLNPDTAKGIWDECNALLAQPDFSCRGIMKHWNVVLVCTTDDPTDSLEHHAAIAADEGFDIQVLPAFRPDKGMAVEQPAAFNAWVDKLAAAADVEIRDLASYREALRQRHYAFHAMGCRISDHGIENFYAADYTESEIEAAFAKIRGGGELDPDQALKLKSAMLHDLAVLDHEKGWTQQFHIGVLRNNATRLFTSLGPDVGADSIADFQIARALNKFLDRLDREGKLARTIVYSLNPAHNNVLMTAIGNFQDGSAAGKLQLGSAWWFNDQIDGMLEQLECLSAMGVLSTFVGMLTDSRSFLSYARHDYFRRLLCNLVGDEIERGLLPRDMALCGRMIADIAYRNAARTFGFQGLPPGNPA
jgi:glucuronate isomerase